jgi:hypothetical protein
MKTSCSPTTSNTPRTIIIIIIITRRTTIIPVIPATMGATATATQGHPPRELKELVSAANRSG